MPLRPQVTKISFHPPSFGIAFVIALAAIAIVPTASASAAESCTASDQTARSCAFTCLEGAEVAAQGTNANEFYKQTFTAACGGAHTSCTASPGETCTSPPAVATSAGNGTCTMEADGEGTVTCSSTGGQAGDCLEDPIDCLCPDLVCGNGLGIPGIPGTPDLPELPDTSKACEKLEETFGKVPDPSIVQDETRTVTPKPVLPCA